MTFARALAAAAETPGFDVLPLIERFGLPLVFLVLLMSGLLVTKKQLDQVVAQWKSQYDALTGFYDDMRKDRDAQRDALAALQTTVTHDMVPAITRSTDAIVQANARDQARRMVGGD